VLIEQRSRASAERCCAASRGLDDRVSVPIPEVHPSMSNRTILERRLAMLVAASLAALGLAAAPALAGSDGDQPPAIEQPPAPPAPTPLPLPQPAPPAAAPAPAPAPAPSSSVKGKRTEKSRPRTTKTVNHPVVLVHRTTTTRATRAVGATTVSTFPTGGVQAGAGGTSLAPGTPVTAIGLGVASLVLLLASGGVAAARRR
jgi:hypothetical protein